MTKGKLRSTQQDFRELFQLTSTPQSSIRMHGASIPTNWRNCCSALSLSF
jgi:hypothetical protein